MHCDAGVGAQGVAGRHAVVWRISRLTIKMVKLSAPAAGVYKVPQNLIIGPLPKKKPEPLSHCWPSKWFLIPRKLALLPSFTPYPPY